MNILLIGYGKMGRALEAAADAKGHSIAGRADVDIAPGSLQAMLREADVALEFTVPSAAPGNIAACLQAGVPVVSGTTGWKDQLADLEKLCREKNGALFYASNFSVGMNLMFAVNRKMAQMFSGRQEYRISIEETHHVHKIDAPSGTAVTLADDILRHHPGYNRWQLDGNGGDVLPVTSHREGEVVGLHRVIFTSENDQIEISHNAFTRKGFVDGALLAAEWLIGKKGVFTMHEMLNL